MKTSIQTMRENLTKLDAKELYYFQWNSGELYTVMAGDGRKFGQLITIGYTDFGGVGDIHRFGLPCIAGCPLN